MATLKISDLSVGDWVQDENGNYVKIAGIWQGHNFDYQVDLHRDGVIGTVVPCNIHSIPITPEILEANGFVKNGEYDEWNIGTWETPYLLGVSLERPAITIKWNGSSIFIDQAKYVHQLQHALRLAGVDKEIVMPNK